MPKDKLVSPNMHYFGEVVGILREQRHVYSTNKLNIKKIENIGLNSALCLMNY
jgi:hypothetical protein